jgi:hypothetical protein
MVFSRLQVDLNLAESSGLEGEYIHALARTSRLVDEGSSVNPKWNRSFNSLRSIYTKRLRDLRMRSNRASRKADDLCR